MWQNRTAAHAALLALLLTGLSGGLPAGAQSGSLIHALGAVTLTSDGVESRADIGMPVDEGDVVETGDDGLAIIQVSDSATLKLRENTRLVMDTLGSETAVSLTSGSVFSRVPGQLVGRFRVRTRTAVAGVRGTEFFVAYGRTIERRPGIWLCVNDGSVEIYVPETDETVEVNEGEGINILGGTRLTEPRFYPWTREPCSRTTCRRPRTGSSSSVSAVQCFSTSALSIPCSTCSST